MGVCVKVLLFVIYVALKDIHGFILLITSND
jgi:hypothetical protein